MRKLLLNLFLSTVGLLFAGQASAQEEIAPGIIKLQAGEIDTFTPYSLFGGKPAVEAMKQLPAAKPPFSPDEVQIKITDRGWLIEVPLEDNEQIYGFGLQFETFGQRGLRKRPIVNDNPLNGLGYTHAPQTFYVSTKGYGILVNTARYTTFLCGSNQKTEHSRQLQAEERKHIATTTEDLYKNRSNGNKVHIDVPGAKGIEVFIITGPAADVFLRCGDSDSNTVSKEMRRKTPSCVLPTISARNRFRATYWDSNRDGRRPLTPVLIAGATTVFQGTKKCWTSCSRKDTK